MKGKLTKEQQKFYDTFYRVYYENYDKIDKECKADALDMLNSVKLQIEKENFHTQDKKQAKERE